MKIAYLGKIQLSDVDLSFLHELQQQADVTYIMEVNPRFKQGPAFDIQTLYPKSGLFKAEEIYPEYKKFKDYINLDNCFVLNTTGKFWLIKSFWTNLLLVIFLVRQHFDVIHCAWPPNLYEFIIYLLKKKMVLTVHDPFPHTGNDSFIVRLRRKMAFRFIPKLILLNKAQRYDFLEFYHLPEHRVFNSQLSSYNFLQIIAPDFTNIPARGTYILFSGKISPYKGLDYLLTAMEKIHEKCPDCRLIIAGGGNYHFDISNYLRLDYIDIRNRFIPDRELVALIQNCAFMVCPYTDATQSGVIMTAFAFNKPIIATNVGGLPEMVLHEHYGIIIKEKDVNALTESIIQLWLQPDKVNTFSDEIKQNYGSGQLSWKKIAKDIIKIYEN